MSNHVAGKSPKEKIKKVVNKKDLFVFLMLIIVTVVVFWGMDFFLIPVINIQSVRFWFYLVVSAGISCILPGLVVFCEFFDDSPIVKYINKLLFSLAAICVVTLVILIIGGLFSSTMFNAKTYAERIEIENKDISKIPSYDDISKIALMDTDSAKMLGDRVVGTLTDVVSQFEVSDIYYTINYKGSVVKVAPLEYGGFFKYLNNKESGIPGYVIVNCETSEAEFIDMPFTYSNSVPSIFDNYIERKMKNEVHGELISDYTFQINEDGTPYWVGTVVENQTFLGADKIVGAILLNASTGETAYYDLVDIPTWVDQIFYGNTASNFYDSYGKFSGGFMNTLTSQKGCTKTTTDYGYIAIEDDIYIYTGVTSLSKDSSNLGFILVNSRTGEYNYVVCDGASEHSAMAAAEGIMQNYNYKASFPSLVNINGEPTYVMVLKDGAGLIKDYAMVNVKNYTVVAVEDSLDKVQVSYLKQLSKDISVDISNTETISIIVDDIKFLTNEGNTFVYITSKGIAYKQALASNEELILVKVGDTVNVTINKGSTDKVILTEIKR